MNSDGDQLFQKSLLSVARSEVPRDGGASLGAFADWLQEQLNDGSAWLAVGDPHSTGFVFIVMNWTGNEFPIRAMLVMTEDPQSTESEAFKDCGKEFREWFAGKAYEFWGER